jgi:hypothetical protein
MKSHISCSALPLHHIATPSTPIPAPESLSPPITSSLDPVPSPCPPLQYIQTDKMSLDIEALIKILDATFSDPDEVRIAPGELDCLI